MSMDDKIDMLGMDIKELNSLVKRKEVERLKLLVQRDEEEIGILLKPRIYLVKG